MEFGKAFEVEEGRRFEGIIEEERFDNSFDDFDEDIGSLNIDDILTKIKEEEEIEEEINTISDEEIKNFTDKFLSEFED